MKELENPNTTIGKCNSIMISATTTNLEEYTKFATLRANLKNNTIASLDAIVASLIEIGAVQVAKGISTIVEEIRESWRELSVQKVETFKKAKRKKSELKGEVKELPKDAAKAAEWLNEIEELLRSKNDPGEITAAKEMCQVTDELVEKSGIEELIRNNYYKNDEETKEALKRLKNSGMKNCVKVIQILRKAMIKYNQGYEVIADFECFEDFPEMFVKYLPKNSKEIADYQSKQIGETTYSRKCRIETRNSIRLGEFSDKGPDNCEEDLRKFAKNCETFIPTKATDEKKRKVVMMIVDTKESARISDEDFEKLLPESSYGRYVQNKEKHVFLSSCEGRAEYQAETVHHNSDFRPYYEDPRDEPVETVDSCGKGCVDSTKCSVKTKYPGQLKLQCGQEFVVLAEDIVSAEEVIHGMRNFVSYNGNQASIEK